MQPSTSNRSNAVRSWLAAGLCLLLAGCNSYSHMTREDKVSPAAGDAVRAAMAMQTVDPWPEYVLDKDLVMDGELAQKRLSDYKAGNTKPLDGARSAGGSTAMP